MSLSQLSECSAVRVKADGTVLGSHNIGTVAKGATGVYTLHTVNGYGPAVAIDLTCEGAKNESATLVQDVTDLTLWTVSTWSSAGAAKDIGFSLKFNTFNT